MKEQYLNIGDIVQITDEKHHWFPCLIVVDEPKSFGCQGYMYIPKDNQGTVVQAYIRLRFEEIELVGMAEIN